MDELIKFNDLVESMTLVHRVLRNRAASSINLYLTVRNWLMGYYIVEYEQAGEDRAAYGEQLLENLAKELANRKIKGCSYRSLNIFRSFYLLYPQFVEFIFSNNILQTLSAELKRPSAKARIIQVDSTLSSELLLNKFSFSHFVELIRQNEPNKRAFYEVEALKGNWSVRQLKRQMETLLYERVGLSRDKSVMLEKLKDARLIDIDDTIKDPYVLEFTGFEEKDEYSETDLETALLNHIQSFLLELGDGFCFEARQKRLSIGNEHDRVDLVFYHRILKCHVLVDLKVRKFNHTDAGQMNYYLNYFRDNFMIETDNPPVGIILCTDKDQSKVTYALGGLDNKMFVSRYKLLLPNEKDLESFIQRDFERLKEPMQNVE